MPSTFFGLTIGKTGINAAQSGINTTAHNAANATTKGFSRQVVSQKATTPISVYSRAGMAGTGVEVTSVKRVRNEYYDEKYRVCNTSYGEYNTKEYYLSSIENYFSEVDPDTQGLTATLTSFKTTLETLKDNPSDSTTRMAAVEYADSLTDYIQYMSTSLQKVQREANTDIKTTAERINSIAAQIATLNKQINTLELQSGTANDLRDERDLLIDELSEYANISVNEINVGDNTTVVHQYTVLLDGKTLVDTYNYNTLKITAETNKVNQNDIDNLYTLSWKDGQDFDSASPTLGGKLQALFEVRDGNNETNFVGSCEGASAGDEFIRITGTNCNKLDQLNIPASDGTIKVGNKIYYYESFTVDIDEDGNYAYTFEGLSDDSGNEMLTLDVQEGTKVSIGSSIDYKGIPYYQAQLNEFCRTFAKTMNAIHNTGQDLNGDAGLDFFTGTDIVTGENLNLFEDITSFYSLGTATEKLEDDEEGAQTGASYYNVTALNFCVNKAIKSDVQKVACASNIVDGVESTDVLDKMIAVLSDNGVFKQGTPSQFLETFTANIGVDNAQAKLFSQSQSNILSAIDEQRMAISSVDEDEEAMNFVKYQNAYELSSKIISTMAELYDVLLGMGA